MLNKNDWNRDPRFRQNHSNCAFISLQAFIIQWMHWCISNMMTSKVIRDWLAEYKVNIILNYFVIQYLEDYCWNFDHMYYSLILSFWGQFQLNYAELLLSNRHGFPEAGDLQTFCKFQKIILSDRKDIHIIHSMIGCLLVGKMLGLFDNTSQIWIHIFVPQAGNSWLVLEFVLVFSIVLFVYQLLMLYCEG